MNKPKYIKHDITILYVEDEEIIRGITAKHLHLIATNVFVAKNGLEGLNLFKKYHIDLIITDISMPELSGIEMLSKIRELDSNIHAIILSGLDKEEYYGDLAKLDLLNDYLSKPCDITDLFEKINQNLKNIKDRIKYKDTFNLLQQHKIAIDASAIVSKTDINGIITYANNNFSKLSGYTRDELLGSNHNIVRHPSVPSEIFKDLWSTIQSKKIWKGKLKNINKTGETYYTDTTIVPLLDSHNKIIEYMAIRFEITQLHNTIKREQKLQKVKSTFLANMSHEIRTPLNGIIGFLDILGKSKLDSKQEEYISIIKNSSDLLLSIINDVLDFSKIEAKELKIENVKFNFKDELETLTPLFYLKAEENGIQFIVDIDNKFPECLISDLLRIKQIITNLVNNALKFTHEGQVILSIKVLEKNDSDITINISVKDTGIGINKDNQRRIFKPFSQTDASTTREYGGTGLGLAITKELISLLGSTLKLESEINKGSEFSFPLKLTICNEKVISNANDKINFKFHGKILIAEDNKINQMLMSHILGIKNIDFTIVQNGLEVVEEYKKNRDSYDIIFMDINMPIMDGIIATKEILVHEQNNNLQHIPIIALTANALSGDREKFLSVGMDDYLSKPINKEEFFDIIAKFSYFTLDRKEKNEPISAEKSINYAMDNVALELELPQEFLKELLDTFFDTVVNEIVELQKAVEFQDYKQIYEIAHSIKGSAGNLRITEVFEKAKEIEQNAKENNDKINYLTLTMELNILIENYKKELH